MSVRSTRLGRVLALTRDLALIALLVSLSSQLFIPSKVSANPFFVGRFDGLMGGPLTQSPFALYWNPANLYSERSELSLHLGGISRQATYNRELPSDTPPDIAAVNGGLATTSALGVIPSLAFRTGWKSGDLKFGVGSGVYIARAGTAGWDRHPEADAQYPGAYDGPQRWSTISTFMLIVNYAAGASVTFKNLSIGAALSYTDAALSTTKAANADKSDALKNSNGEIQEGRVFLDNAVGEDLALTLGAHFRHEDLEIGYAYRLPVVYELVGRANVLYANSESDTIAKVEFQVADSHLASIAYHIDELTLRAEYEFQGWSLMDQQRIVSGSGEELLILQRNFEDTNAYRLRFDYAFQEGFIAHIGLSYEEGVTIEEYHEPGLAEHDQVEAGIGLTAPLSENLSLNSTFFYQHFFDRKISNSEQQPAMNGEYTDRRQYLSLNLVWRL